MTDWGKIAVALRVGSGAHPYFVQSWTKLLTDGLRTGDVVLEPTAGLPHHYAAEALAKQFMHSTACDTILYIDDDMRFTADTVSRMREHKEGHSFDIMQALCVCSQPPYGPQVGDCRPTMGSVNDVPHCGLAFTFIRRTALMAVVKAKPKGEFCFTWGADGTAEDVSFCRKAVAQGCTCGMDTAVSVGHIVDMVATYNGAKQTRDLAGLAYAGRDTIREVMG